VTIQRDSITLREYDLKDYDEVFSFWGSIERGLGIGASDSRAEIEKFVAHNPGMFILAEDGGRIVGTVMGGFDGRRGMIYHLAVTAAYRERGLGQRLMQEIEQRLAARGCRRCHMIVHNDNPAIAFYERRGWSDMTTRVIVMGKEIE
jgi:putative acetyltransferase